MNLLPLYPWWRRCKKNSNDLNLLDPETYYDQEYQNSHREIEKYYYGYGGSQLEYLTTTWKCTLPLHKFKGGILWRHTYSRKNTPWPGPKQEVFMDEFLMCLQGKIDINIKKYSGGRPKRCDTGKHNCQGDKGKYWVIVW